jgi:hypothetical protein
MPFEALDQPPGFGGRKGFVERSLGVDVDCPGPERSSWRARREIGQVFQDMGIIHGGMMTIRTLTWRQPPSGANIMKRLAVPLRSYSQSKRAGRPAFIGIGTRVSAWCCFEVSSLQPVNSEPDLASIPMARGEVRARRPRSTNKRGLPAARKARTRPVLRRR